MNMTLIDDRGRSIKCQLVHSRRQAAPRKQLASIVSRNEVILTFETAEEAKKVFHFTWLKVLKQKLSWVRRKSA